MMDFMDHLRRGVDRAGFEVDRLLRANRTRAQIASIRSQMDEELRQIGRQVVELYDRGEQLPGPLLDRCDRVQRYEAEIAQREIELEGINSEIPPDVEVESSTSMPVPKCPVCGHVVHEGARFCSNCGASLVVASGEVPVPPTSTEPLAKPASPSSEPPAPAG